MELSPRSQQNPPELGEVIGEESTPRSTDQDSEENQCQTSVFQEPSVAEKKKCAVEHEDFTHLPGGEEKEKDRDGSSQEKMQVDNTEQCHGPVSCVEPSTAPAKRAAKKKKYATEHVDVTHLPGGEKDRDGIVPDRVKDKEDDPDSSQEKMEVGVEPSFSRAKKPWAAEKKKSATEHVDVTHHSFNKPWTAEMKRCATEHVDVTHLPSGEKDRDGFSLENVEVDNCIVPDKDKDEKDDLDAFQEKMEVGVEPSFALAKNPWGAEKKKNAVQHEDVTHLLGEEKEEEDRDGFFQENKEVDNTEQCHKPSTAQAKEKMKLGISLQQQQQLQLPLQQPASHPQPATTSSQPHSPFRLIDPYRNHALWFFAEEISQSKFQGRTSSNACTFIALLMGKLFSITKNATVNIRNEPSSPQVWLKILTTAIQAGNGVHDRVTGRQPINFSVRGALRHLDGCLGSTRVEEALDVGFTNEDSQVPQSSLSFYLGRLSHEASNIAALVIANEMTICFVARGGKLFVLDSHSHSPYGAMVGVSDMSRRESFLATVKEELRLPHNLCSLTFVEFL